MTESRQRFKTSVALQRHEIPTSECRTRKLVAGFIDLGFRRVGRLAAAPVGGMESLAAGYGPEDAKRFLEMAPMPTPILASPDGTALADV